MKTIIKNGMITNSDSSYRADIKIEDGIIVEISEYISTKESEHVINANGQYVFPGGIDVHTHLDLPGTVDDFSSGTKAAAYGGITTIVNFTNPIEGQTVIENLIDWKERAKNSHIDYSFHSIINECNDFVLEEIPKLVDEGVTSIKLFMANQDESIVLNDSDIYRLMKKASEEGILVSVHAENGEIINQLIQEYVLEGKTSVHYHAETRPTILEAEATNRAIRIAELTNNPIYIVHVSCSDALYQIKEAQKRGVPVYAETCPQYLVLDESYLKKLESESVKYVCSPPLRKKDEQLALWEGISTGTISTIGSDHSSIPFSSKYSSRDDFTKIPNGCPGIEDSFSLLYHFGVHEQRISIQKFIEVISTNPAKIFGLYPEKGTIQIGSDADLVILDPEATRVISEDTQIQNTDYTLYEGTIVHGVITHVLSRGKEIVKNRTFLGSEGDGRFLHRRTSDLMNT